MNAPTGLRVAVVDDSVVVRRLVADMLSSDPKVSEVRTAGNGEEGVALVRSFEPDAVTMDIEMPLMDGITAVREIRRFNRTVPIIMFSTLTEAGAKAALDAMSAGATDFVTKPGQASSIGASMTTIRREVIAKVHALTSASRGRPAAQGTLVSPPTVRSPAPPPVPPPGLRPAPAPGPGRRLPAPGVRPPGSLAVPPSRGAGRRRGGPPRIVGVGSSTGGPEALAAVLPRLTAALSVPVVVTQHMPPMFTRLLAERLDASCAVRVVEGVDGAILTPGTVTIAPGGLHMTVVKDGVVLRVALRDTPPVNSCKPAADVMFQSLPAAVGSAALVVVLTGMGSDGARGAAAVAAAGGRVWAQDEATSVVWGMPGATVSEAPVERVLPLGSIADNLLSALSSTRVPAAPGSAL